MSRTISARFSINCSHARYMEYLHTHTGRLPTLLQRCKIGTKLVEIYKNLLRRRLVTGDRNIPKTVNNIPQYQIS